MYVLRLVTDFLIEVRGLVHGLSILEGETYERFEETKKGGLLNRGHSFNSYVDQILPNFTFMICSHDQAWTCY
jgi:hypothetical protein